MYALFCNLTSTLINVLTKFAIIYNYATDDILLTLKVSREII